MSLTAPSSPSAATRAPEHFCGDAARSFALALPSHGLEGGIVLDLSQTRSLDASGVMAIAAAWKRARRFGQAFAITGAEGAVAALLREAGFAQAGVQPEARPRALQTAAGQGWSAHRPARSGLSARLASPAGAAVLALALLATALSGCSTPSLFWPEAGAGGHDPRRTASTVTMPPAMLQARADALAADIIGRMPPEDAPAFGRAGLAAAARQVELARRLILAGLPEDAARSLDAAAATLAMQPVAAPPQQTARISDVTP